MEDDAPPTTDEAPVDAAARGTADILRLSGSQRDLFRALEDRDGSLGRMYLGSLVVLRNAGNPDRFPQCAHSIRELMEKIPRAMDVPVKAHQERLGDKARNLSGAFADAQKNTRCLSGAKRWNGQIDRPLRNFLRRCEEFFEWMASHRPRRRDELLKMLARLGGSGQALPEPLASRKAAVWRELNGYFQSIAHHRRSAEQDEFRQQVDALERFLLDELMPKTFDDFDEIDTLLREAADNA